MYNINIGSWQELEDFSLALLNHDHPKKPAGSGNSKKEEDVVGRSCIVQCKYTDNETISLKSKDIARLMGAAHEQGKFPLFISSACYNTAISLVFDGENNDIIKHLIQKAIIHKSLENIKLIIDKNLIRNISTYNKVQKEVKRLKRLLKKETDTIKDITSDIDKKLQSKYDDLTIIDLFEGEKNGS